MRNIEELILRMEELEASDLLLIPGKPPTYKIYMRFESAGEPPLLPLDTEAFAEYLLTPEQRERFRRERQLDFAWAPGTGARYRINLYYQRGTVSLAIRSIPGEPPLPNEIGLPSALVGLADRPNGLILVTGPTGSGKSTTLAALIENLNRRREVHIITIEDPIEFVFSSKTALISQREVGNDVPSFPLALKAALRQAPNVIVVGEMRDLETIRAAITAAETGHLVIATLHTRSAAQTVDRIIDVFPEEEKNQIRLQLSNNLLGVFSQRLLPRVDGKGLQITYELLLANPAVRTLVREGKTHQIDGVLETGVNEGMVSLERHLASLVHMGLVSLEDARAYARDAGLLESYLRKEAVHAHRG